MNLLKKLINQREFALFIVILLTFIAMSFASPYFFTIRNIISLSLALSITTIIGVAMTNLLVSGGFDLSVGSLVGLIGIIVGMLIKNGVPVYVAIILALGIGALVGLMNGLLIAKVGMNAFIVTLAGMSILRGLTYIISQGRSQTQLGDLFDSIGQTKFLGIDLPIWYTIIFIIVGDLLLRRSRFFRQNYYIGGNERAAHLSGIPVNRMKILNYVIASLITAFAAIVHTSRLGAAATAAGQGFEFQVITAVIIGGASLSGGEGTVFGTFLGALLMVLIINILVLLGINVYWQNFVIGTVLLFAVMLDTLSVKSREKRIVITAG
jgi:ribose transport system permease protein